MSIDWEAVYPGASFSESEDGLGSFLVSVTAAMFVGACIVGEIAMLKDLKTFKGGRRGNKSSGPRESYRYEQGKSEI